MVEGVQGEEGSNQANEAETIDKNGVLSEALVNVTGCISTWSTPSKDSTSDVYHLAFEH